MTARRFAARMLELVRKRADRGRTTWALDALSVLGLVVVVTLAHVAAADQFAYDAHAYWAAGGYAIPQGDPDAFAYTPVALLACRAIASVLPWPAFLEVYSLAMAIGIWILAGPLTAFAALTPSVATELLLGNIHIFLAVVAVAGLRWPALWAFALLTKVTPGIGALWFVFRGEWRSVARVVAVTLAIALPTVMLAPNLWVEWIDYLSRTTAVPGSSGYPLAIRLPIAIALVFVGARRDWPWLVPLAVTFSPPVLWGLQGMSMLLGVVWFVRRDGLPWLLRASRALSVRFAATPASLL